MSIAVSDPGRVQRDILVALSGGVDSAVTALLLTQIGYTCHGVMMHLFGEQSPEETKDAEAICARLGMDFSCADLSAAFRAEVIDRFVSGYEAGRTPNPCLYCNRHLKFGALLDLADARGIDCLATGHYARVEAPEEPGGRWKLRKAVDLRKDQSYVLYGLTQAQLARVLFPLGDLNGKDEVRALAQANGFLNAHRKDSQDICFVPDGDYASVITALSGHNSPAGAFIGPDGRVLGQHKGLIHYTIGQRKGLGLALPEPLYVCGKRCEDNAVLLCRNEDLYSGELDACEANWIACEPPKKTMRVSAKVRYNMTEQPATVTVTGEGRFHLIFDEPQRAITSGQAVVLYDGEYVVGGGIIE